MCGLILCILEVITETCRIKCCRDELLARNFGKLEIDIEESIQIPYRVEIITIQCTNGVCQLGTIYGQHEHDMVRGKYVLRGLKKFDGIRGTAPVQFVDHNDQRQPAFRLRQISCYILKRTAKGFKQFLGFSVISHSFRRIGGEGLANPFVQ